MFIAFVGKEIRHILRDRRTMLILFGMPLIMMLLFGFAISTDVKDVRLVAVTTPADHLTQRMLARLDASEYFILTHTAQTTAEAEQLIRNGQADIAIIFSPHFADRLPKSQGQVQLILDGADPNQASMQGAYATQILQAGMAEATSAAHVPQSTEIITRLLYNPQMKSAYNFVPGIMGLLLLLICAMMTSVSIVREKERGTMEVLLVSPIRPLLILIAKAVPYFLLSIIILLFAESSRFRQSSRHPHALPALYFSCPLPWLAHQCRGKDSATSFAYLRYADADAQLATFGHDLPYRKYAPPLAMVLGHYSGALVHCRHSQTDGYGCRLANGGARTPNPYGYESVNSWHCTEKV